jgi:hypothetical protein
VSKRADKRQKIVDRLKGLKVGDQITLADGREQRLYLEIGKTLFQAKAINFKLHTHAAAGGGFVAVAVGSPR